MANDSKENNRPFCEKCQRFMEKEKPLPPRSLDMYSGSTNIAHSSVATATRIGPASTVLSTTRRDAFSFDTGSTVTQIITFVCPSCGGKKQILFNDGSDV